MGGHTQRLRDPDASNAVNILTRLPNSTMAQDINKYTKIGEFRTASDSNLLPADWILPPVPILYEGNYFATVHHFKWRASQIDVMQRKMAITQDDSIKSHWLNLKNSNWSVAGLGEIHTRCLDLRESSRGKRKDKNLPRKTKTLHPCNNSETRDNCDDKVGRSARPYLQYDGGASNSTSENRQTPLTTELTEAIAKVNGNLFPALSAEEIFSMIPDSRSFNQALLTPRVRHKIRKLCKSSEEHCYATIVPKLRNEALFLVIDSNWAGDSNRFAFPNFLYDEICTASHTKNSINMATASEFVNGLNSKTLQPKDIEHLRKLDSGEKNVIFRICRRQKDFYSFD